LYRPFPVMILVIYLALQSIKLDPDIEFLIMDFSLNCTIYT
jgi:hypothetical protein